MSQTQHAEVFKEGMQKFILSLQIYLIVHT